MGLQIEDPSTGLTAKVDSSNRLKVQSKSRPSEEVEAARGNSFILHGVCRTAAAAAGGLFHFLNTSTTDEWVVTRIFIYPQTLTDADLLITQVKNPTINAAGTDISTTGIVQKNFGSGKTLGGTLTISDASADMTFTGGDDYHEIPLISRTMNSRNMKGTNVVTPQTAIGFAFKLEDGTSAVGDQIISISVNGYKREVGTGNSE